jgi:hypothetical protein
MDKMIELTNKCDRLEDKNGIQIQLNLDELMDDYIKIEKKLDEPI